MHRFRMLRVLAITGIAAAFMLSHAGILTARDSSEALYEALSPWGEADPKPLKGISTRLDNFSGKKIGIFANYKRAAIPIAMSLQERIKADYPDTKVSIYHSDQWNVTEIETEKKETFKKWVEGVDTVILLVGD